MSNQHPRVKRDIVVGWSAGAARRNLRFLYSIDERELTGEGLALTLTVRDCPPSPESWHLLVRDYFRQVGRVLARGGHALLRYHYVTEWQRRGVPHLHGAVYVSDGAGASVNLPNVLKGVWEGYAAPYGVNLKAQYVLPITGVLGWFQYVSKHAARGIRHYQRSAANIPDSWRKGTGRMWGKGGAWAIMTLCASTWITMAITSCGAGRVPGALLMLGLRFRTLNAIKRPDQYLSAKRRLVSARGCLRCPDPHLSPSVASRNGSVKISCSA